MHAILGVPSPMFCWPDLVHHSAAIQSSHSIVAFSVYNEFMQHYIVLGDQMFGQSQNAKLGHLEPLSWYQIKILTDLIRCVLCYTVLIQVHTPITQLQFGTIIIRLTHTNAWESVRKLCRCVQFIKSHIFYCKSFENL